MPRDAEAWLAARGVPREPVLARGPEGAPPPGAAEVRDLVRQARQDEAAAVAPGGGVVAALAFVQRSTANAPQSEGRLRAKLADRGHDPEEVEAALVRARGLGLVDDDALLAALISERRSRGHAEPRLRRDLRDRGFDGPAVDAALARHRDTDPLAAAFGLAREQAARQRSVPPEAAVRRIAAYLVRRGHGDAVARKAARDAVHADREPQRAAER